eukprot:6185002-Pleurochrysis_carterae.AAC.2
MRHPQRMTLTSAYADWQLFTHLVAADVAPTGVIHTSCPEQICGVLRLHRHAPSRHRLHISRKIALVATASYAAGVPARSRDLSFAYRHGTAATLAHSLYSLSVTLRVTILLFSCRATLATATRPMTLRHPGSDAFKETKLAAYR